jgi:hypothetical protein
MTTEATRNKACVPIAGAARAFSAHVALSLLAMVVLLFGCDSKLTPDQIAAIEKVETAKAAYSREFQPQMDSLKRCMGASQDSLKRCMDESLVERCADRCKQIFKPRSEKQVELERCADRCLDDVEERRLVSELCMKKGEDQSSCGKQFAAASKPSSADYDLALKLCIESGVPSDYCTGKRKYK